MKIGLLSDTHSYFHERIPHHFQQVDEIWHAGDFGSLEVLDNLARIKPVRGVYGNVDGQDIRKVCPKHSLFTVAGLKVYMTHIGGYPGRYNLDAKKIILREKPALFISGHSHILKVMPDAKNNLLHMNPGACGMQGWHQNLTLIRFDILEGKVKNVEVIDLGLRGSQKIPDEK